MARAYGLAVQNRTGLLGALRVLVLCLVLGLGAAAPAQAGHFRYGSLSWRTMATDPTRNTVQFKVSQSWRLSFSAFAGVTVGSRVLTDQLRFGDGRSADIYLTVTSVDVAGDSFYGEATITHTYAAAGNFVASYTNCCRLSSLANNSDGNWYVSSLVNAGSGNSSPVSTLAPMVNLAVGQAAASFQLPVSDPDGDALTYSMATQADFNNFPFRNAPMLAVNPTTGLVTFNTAIAVAGQLYNGVIKVSDGRTSILVDFLISVTGASTAPVFDYSITPPNGFVYQLAPGQSLTFGVRAADADAGDVVRLQGFGLPVGASTAPALPLNGNPVQSTFTWTPTAAQMGTTVINFVAQDLAGVQAATSVTIEVSLRPRFDVGPTPAHRSVVQITPGRALSYTIQASDPDAADRVSIVTASGLPSGGSLGPALPTAAANPTTTQLNWTPALANWGPHAVTFTARDTYNEQATHTLNFLVNSAPSFTSQPGGLSVAAGQTFRYNIVTTDPDLPYGDRLDVLATTLPAWLTLVDHGNGTATLSGTPGASHTGAHRVVLQSEDIYHHGNAYGFITQAFTINVFACTTVLQATATNPTCAPANSGSIALAVTGATAPVTFAWTGPNGYTSTAQSPTNLVAGSYTVTSTDANRCTATAQVTLTAPAPATAPTAKVAIDSPVDPDRPTTIFLGYGPQTATLKAAGGVSYVWSPATNLSSATAASTVFSPTAGGTYTFTVTTANAAGCTASASVTVYVVDARCGSKNEKVLVCHNGRTLCIAPSAVAAHLRHSSKHNDYLGSCTANGAVANGPAVSAETAAEAAAVVLEAYPNPFASGTTVHFRATETAAASVQVYDHMGRPVATLFNAVAETGRDYSLSLDSRGLPAGLYQCRFVANGTTKTVRLVVAK